MMIPPPVIAVDRGRHELQALAVLFEDMDRAYRRVAGLHHLDCQGCPDNCCRTLFHHHTLVEVLYVYTGLCSPQAVEQRAECFRRAQAFQCAQAKAAAGQVPSRAWCPLSQQARCRLYAFRPMICRLHGVPNRFRHPVRGWVSGPGCHRLPPSLPAAPDQWLDRTPFSERLADIERRLRTRLAFHARVRMTLADMLITLQPHLDPAVPPFEGATGSTER